MLEWVRWITPRRFLRGWLRLTSTISQMEPSMVSQRLPQEVMPLFSPALSGEEGWGYFASSQIFIAGKLYEKPKFYKFYGKFRTAVVDPTSSSLTSSLYSMKELSSCWTINVTCPTQYPTYLLLGFFLIINWFLRSDRFLGVSLSSYSEGFASWSSDVILWHV